MPRNPLNPRLAVREQANGLVYLLRDLFVLFPYGSDNPPKLIVGDQLVTVDRPERFGPWASHKQKLKWFHNFRRAAQVKGE
jgi:hypothetical protein